ncbi:hypothetical protein M6B38_360765 [Iris pallida]|uniref:Metallothionein n=1 Tax=Iris pallida TaxID=29817 RepID=A0AAX6GK92_IRIPA|nr:hypothetical protein M6B38_383040 [Iris pallida]KAJ6828718.1 hypothetical protein M6B38_360765 [Iris pallida]
MMAFVSEYGCVSSGVSKCMCPCDLCRL